MRKPYLLTKKFIACGLSAAIALTSSFTVTSTEAAAAGAGEKSIQDVWKKAISIDFGISSEINGVTSKIKTASGEADADGNRELAQLIPNAEGYKDYAKEENADLVGDIVQCDGTLLYENSTVQDLYGENTDFQQKQKIGFNKVVPAAITSGGDYFNDWVFSPDGAEYSLSVDLIPGQYYVCVYTGNKVKEKDNTTFVNFNNEKAAGSTILYDQTSIGGQQFYGPEGNKISTKDNKFIYSVDVQDNGKGTGTLVLNLSDPTMGKEDYAASHQIKVSDAIQSADAFSNLTDDEKGSYADIKAVDLYKDTEFEVDEAEELADKCVTARLNGIEIVPVKQPKHITPAAFTVPDKLSMEMGSEPQKLMDNLSDFTDRIVFGSSDSTVAKVNVYTGEVTPVGVGTAKISAYSGYVDASVSCNVTVTPETVVKLDKPNTELIMGSENTETGSLTATFNVADSDVIEWSVDTQGVIDIGAPSFSKGSVESTSTVTIKALKTGRVTVTATRKDTGKTAKCTVNVVKLVSSFSITKEDGTVIASSEAGNTTSQPINMYKGDALTIKTAITPEDATNKKITFESSDKNVVSVSEKGDGAIISASGVGEATITCTAASNPDVTVTFKVTVTEKPADPTSKPAATAAPVPTSSHATSQANPSPDTKPSGQTDADTVVIKLSGKAKVTIKIKKSMIFKASAKGSSISKLTYKIKSGKKFIKVKINKKKSVKISARKKGTAKVIITIKAANGLTKKFTRTVIVK